MSKKIDANYGPTQDVAFSISVQAAGPGATVIKPENIRLYGPECDGCALKNKVVMIVYTENNNRKIFDLFLNSANAEVFLSDVDKSRSKGDVPLILAFKNSIDGEEKAFLIEGNNLSVFLRDLDRQRKKISDVIEHSKSHPAEETIPMRRSEPTEQELLAAIQDMAKDYKSEPRDVSLEGIDLGLLLAALYNNAKTGGTGLKKYRDALMTPAEGQHILSELSRIGALPEIDYINGRSIKCWFDKGKNVLTFSRYWEFNGIPSAAIISLARRGLYGVLSGQGGLDVQNEAAIIHESALDNDEGFRVDDVTVRVLQNNQRLYLEARRPSSEPNIYQISIAGNGRVRGEVGKFIRPYVEDQTPSGYPTPYPR